MKHCNDHRIMVSASAIACSCAVFGEIVPNGQGRRLLHDFLVRGCRLQTVADRFGKSEGA